MGRLFSIRIKIVSLISVVVLVLAGMYAVYAPSRYQKAGRQALRNRAEAEAALLADGVKTALDFGQTDDAQKTLHTGLANPIMAWAAVYGQDGKRVTHAEPRGAETPPESLGGRLLPPTAHSRGREIEAGDNAVAVMVPIGKKGKLGSVAVALHTKEVARVVAQMRSDAYVVAALVALVGLLAGFIISHRIARPIERITRAAETIADGTIPASFPIENTRDEVGALSVAFGTMSQRLRDLVGHIGASADSLATAAAGMFSEVREQEALATQQTASLEEIRRTLESLQGAAEQVEVDATAVRTMSHTSLESSQQIAERTRLVSAHSDRIGEILSLIQDIADRSNLLALNAALEGTKAGEVGRGFSLVAAEMRRLSEHVKDSVRDIRKLVADMREASHSSVLATEEGIKLSDQTSSAATKISEAVARQRAGTSQVKSSADENRARRQRIAAWARGDDLVGRGAAVALAEPQGGGERVPPRNVR